MTPAPASAVAQNSASHAAATTGLLIVNGDDWGRDQRTTQMMFDCVLRGSVSSVSAMVFMEDSERAAALAREHQIDAGLHLNFTTPFSAGAGGTRLADRQRELARHLRRHRFAQMMYHPGLTRSFEYVVTSQIEEYRRLYGCDPSSIDGHHHMHLCANVLVQKLLPAGTLVRRNFSFQFGEKGRLNRAYRNFIDRWLQRHHCTVDFLFALSPLEPERLRRIVTLAREFVVEVETHPIQPDEYRYLTSDQLFNSLESSRIGSRSLARRIGRGERGDA
jgi:hypothetical protein